MRGKCQQCGRMGTIRARGICESCEAAIAEEIQVRVRTIHQALDVLRNGAEPSVKWKACNRILQEAEALHRYEALGILTTAPPPSALLADFRAKREALEREGQERAA